MGYYIPRQTIPLARRRANTTPENALNAAAAKFAENANSDAGAGGGVPAGVRARPGPAAGRGRRPQSGVCLPLRVCVCACVGAWVCVLFVGFCSESVDRWMRLYWCRREDVAVVSARVRVRVRMVACVRVSVQHCMGVGMWMRGSAKSILTHNSPL